MLQKSAGPAAPTSLDIVFWLLERAAGEGRPLDRERLFRILYLAQSRYVAAHHGRLLMPACFLARGHVPVEPTAEKILESGVQNPWSPELDRATRTFLEQIWRGLGVLPVMALDRLVWADKAFQRAQTIGPDAEIRFEQLPGAGGSGDERWPSRPSSAEPAAKKTVTAPGWADTDLRFTADGRAVTRWRPKRRLESASQA